MEHLSRGAARLVEPTEECQGISDPKQQIGGGYDRKKNEMETRSRNNGFTAVAHQVKTRGSAVDGHRLGDGSLGGPASRGCGKQTHVHLGDEREPARLRLKQRHRGP